MTPRRRGEKAKLMTEINITPFTDVVLVLLIIFMITTPIIYQNKVKVNLPNTKNGQTDTKPQKVIVAITESGDIYLENVRYRIGSDAEKLKKKITSLAGGSDESAVLINADRNCRYNSIMGVIDIAKQIGIKKIMLGADSKK